MATGTQEKDLQVSGNSPAEMIRMAVSGNANLEQLEKLLEIQERWEKNEARKAYHKAMSEFKANPPTIDKDKSVSFGTGKAAYKHASLYNVIKKISAALSKYGLSAAWTTSQENGSISVTCKITHELGHSEETKLSAPSDTSGSKNAIQAIGSTVTYLERYTLLSLTGLATVEQDDDGLTATTELVSDKQLHQLRDMIIEVKADEVKFLAYLGIESLDKLAANAFQKAMNALEAKRKKKA